jgi:hypothetical protein
MQHQAHPVGARDRFSVSRSSSPGPNEGVPGDALGQLRAGVADQRAEREARRGRSGWLSRAEGDIGGLHSAILACIGGGGRELGGPCGSARRNAAWAWTVRCAGRWCRPGSAGPERPECRSAPPTRAPGRRGSSGTGRQGSVSARVTPWSGCPLNLAHPAAHRIGRGAGDAGPRLGRRSARRCGFSPAAVR